MLVFIEPDTREIITKPYIPVSITPNCSVEIIELGKGCRISKIKVKNKESP